MAGAAALVVLARLFGSVELAGLAAAGAVAVALAMIRLRAAAVPYHAERRVEPARVAAGEGARVRLRFTNPTERPGRLAAVATDALDGGVARCVVPPIQPGEVAEADYALFTGKRGVFPLGALSLSVTDPWGLAEVAVVTPPEGRLVVHPAVEQLVPLPGPSSREGQTGTGRKVRAPVAHDFFALREYESGDDLRRVHWRSTARTGRLMLRQDEVRAAEVATVLIDTRRSTHSAESFERALEVGASLAAAVLAGGRPLRFVTTAGFELGELAPSRWPVLLDHLAAAGPDRRDRFLAVCDSLRRRPSGPLVAVVAAAEPAELAALGALGPRLGLVFVASLAPRPRPVPGAVVVPAAGPVPFARAWEQAVRSCRARVPVRR